MTSDRREKKPLPCGIAQDISHLRLRYPLGTWDTRVSRRFGRIRELPSLPASRLQGQDPPSLGWTYYDSLGPASDGPASSNVSWSYVENPTSVITAVAVITMHTNGILKTSKFLITHIHFSNTLSSRKKAMT